MEQFVSQDPRSNSSYFDLKIWFRARNVTGTFEKRAPAAGPVGRKSKVSAREEYETNV